MVETLERLLQEGLAALEGVTSSQALRDWESRFIGKKGALTELLRGVGSLPKEERAAFGKRANEVKEALLAAYSEREAIVQQQELAADLEGGQIDVTLPGRAPGQGGLHPSTRTLREFYAIWARMGFQVYRSRDVEDDDTNFTFLNMPPHHPARDM